MSQPFVMTDLPDIPALPVAFRALAQHQLLHRGTTSDHLLILADGVAEAAVTARLMALDQLAGALDTLADELRRRAPDYAR